MKKKSVIIFLSIFFITFMLAGYTGLKKTSFPKKYTRNMYAEKYNLSTIGDLIADDTLEQSFISKLDVLDAVSVKYISYGSTATGSMLVEIEDENDQLIYKNLFQLNDLTDDDTVEFNFDAQKNVKGKTYTLKIDIDNLKSESGITFYGEDVNEALTTTVLDTASSLAIGQYGQEAGYFYSLFFIGLLAIEFFTFMLVYYKNKKIIIKNKKINNVLTLIESLLCSIAALKFATSYVYDSRIVYLCIPVVGITGLLLLRNIIINLYSGKLEDIFLAIAIPIGTLYWITLVPGIIPDEQFHYNEIFQLLNGNLFRTKYDVIEMPVYDNYLAAREALVNQNFIEFFVSGQRTGGYSYLLYLPATIGVVLGRIFNLTTLGTIYVGSYFNFIMYIIIGYYIIKILPLCKNAAFVYLLNPMLLHQVTSVSCDAMIMLSCLLFITYIFYLKYSKNDVELRDSIILSVLALYVVVSKNAYFPLLFLLFLIKDKFVIKNKLNKKMVFPLLFAVTLGIILVVVPRFVNALASAVDSTSGMITANPSKLRYLLSNPFNIVYLVCNTLFHNLPFYIMSFAGGSLGSLTINIPFYVLTMYYVILLLSIFMDKETIELSFKNKIIIFIIWLFNMAIIFGGLYVGWGDLHELIVDGVQGRYFIPITLLLVFLISNKNSYIKFKNNNFIVLMFTSVVNLITLLYIVLAFIK